ncbi:MAG: acyl-CoA dehydrogenase, partial [Flavobacteriaceae bacterium]|nr:acyl-CoA dehydrogenase [Flavobacteriaceae bacterium]
MAGHIEEQDIHRAAKQDTYEGPDFYNLDDLLSEEHKLVRSTIRDWVK